jgi:hypothetical protein
MELGPREEKNATSGDICCPITVFVKLNFTTGFLSHKYTSLGKNQVVQLLVFRERDFSSKALISTSKMHEDPFPKLADTHKDTLLMQMMQ